VSVESIEELACANPRRCVRTDPPVLAGDLENPDLGHHPNSLASFSTEIVQKSVEEQHVTPRLPACYSDV
jgi:hypothetical protein